MIQRKVGSMVRELLYNIFGLAQMVAGGVSVYRIFRHGFSGSRVASMLGFLVAGVSALRLIGRNNLAGQTNRTLGPQNNLRIAAIHGTLLMVTIWICERIVAFGSRRWLSAPMAVVAVVSSLAINVAVMLWYFMTCQRPEFLEAKRRLLQDIRRDNSSHVG